MQFGAIIIGDEIMSGKRQDKHMPQVISTLGERRDNLGHMLVLALAGHDFVADDDRPELHRHSQLWM